MIFTVAISILALVAATLYRREHRRRIMAEHALTEERRRCITAEFELAEQSAVMHAMARDLEARGARKDVWVERKAVVS